MARGEGARGALLDRNPPQDKKAEFEQALGRKIIRMIGLSDMEEEQRRRSDRIGGNLYYGRHWNAFMPKNRAAITANVTKALIDHKIAIMTKQLPVPVVEPDDVGDVQGAVLMRSVLQRQWLEDDMILKARQALRLVNSTRTCAGKTMWDPEKKGGVGDVTTDVIPGWRMILDPRTRFPERMEFIGDRATMSRSRAMLLYPTATKDLTNAGEQTNKLFAGGATTESPVKSMFGSAGGVQYAEGTGATMVNGKPVITAFTGISPRGGANPEHEVTIAEVYFRDRTRYKKSVPKKDALGEPITKIKRDEDGAPMFERTDEMDPVLGEPGFKLVKEEVMEERLVPKYPMWRRTTMLFPDMAVLDDRAWDAPQPYSLLLDNEPLEGPWAKGCGLDLEDIQAALNVSLSTMMDNLRFGSYRAFKATNSANIEKNNLVLSPGDILRVGNDIGNLAPLEFPQISEAWFNWVNQLISLMERIIGASGIMQGTAEQAPRTDSAAGFDSLAEIGGSRIVECTQRFEHWISDIYRKVGWYAQRYYTEAHAIKVEDTEGELTWERASSPQLAGTFSYKVQIGSTLAWNASSKRKRILEDMQQGLRDRISAWQELEIPMWQNIKTRMETQSPILNSPPPAKKKPSGKKNTAAA
jgi:hypothetical protein